MVDLSSIISPVLFLLYTNDINKCAPELNFIKFADDTAVYCMHENNYTLVNTVNEQLVPRTRHRGTTGEARGASACVSYAA